MVDRSAAGVHSTADAPDAAGDADWATTGDPAGTSAAATTAVTRATRRMNPFILDPPVRLDEWVSERVMDLLSRVQAGLTRLNR
jgi:hypothetical protein